MNATTVGGFTPAQLELVARLIASEKDHANGRLRMYVEDGDLPAAREEVALLNDLDALAYRTSVLRNPRPVDRTDPTMPMGEHGNVRVD